MENWLSVKNYAEVNGISTQAVYKRIEKGYITEDRLTRSEGGILLIKLADIEDLRGAFK